MDTGDEKQRFKSIIEAAIVLTPEQLTDNSPTEVADSGTRKTHCNKITESIF